MFNALPASQALPRRARRGRRTTVKDGKIVAKFFNEVAGRPYPPIGQLTDTISVQMTAVMLNFFTTSTLVNTYASQVFSVNSLGAASSYLALFDQYRIDQLEVWIEPAAPVQVANSYCEFATAIDLDDANVPTSFGQVGDHPGALVGLGSAGRYHKWKPHVAIAGFSGAFTSYTNVAAPWIDSASPGVQHFGLKAATTISAVATQYNISIRAKVSFRAPGIA